MQQGTSYNSLKPILSLSISYSAQAQSSHQENPAQEGIWSVTPATHLELS